MKEKFYKIRVSVEMDIEVIVKDTNLNRASEIARNFVRQTYKDCRTTSANLIEIVKNSDIFITTNYGDKNGE